MKKLAVFFFLFSAIAPINAQKQDRNIIIITTDGFRWQEVFNGMDSTIANSPKFNEDDSSYLFEKYWDNNNEARRKKLLPFLWTTVLEKGQLFGNRTKGNKVNNANPYWFSYPGYSEIMTGYADTAINSNSYPANPHVSVLEFLNNEKKLKGKVAAFAAWNAFDRILNEGRSGIPVINAFDEIGGAKPTTNEKMINKLLKDSYKPWHEDECLDVFAHYAAMEWLKTRKPKVLYISYGETDEWAHAGKYMSYLEAAHQVDAWIKEIWEYVQADPTYKDKTTLFITTDHGRGDINKDEWTSHNNKVAGSDQIWFAVIGPDTPARGELNNDVQLYQKQFAQTIANLMGYTYTANHPIAEPVRYVFKMKK